MKKETLEEFLSRPKSNLLGLTPGLHGQLEDQGITTIGCLVELDIESTLFPGSSKRALAKIQQELLKQVEQLKARDLGTVPLATTATPEPQEESPAPAVTDAAISEPEEKPDTQAIDESVFVAGRLWSQKTTESAFAETLSVKWSQFCKHAFVCGGSGSGKTVLAKSLVEQAAASGIPSIVLDPGGDLGFLALRTSNLADDDAVKECAKVFTERYPRSGGAKESLKKWLTILETHRELQRNGMVSSTDIANVTEKSFVRLYCLKTSARGIQLALPPFNPDLFRQLQGEDESEFGIRLDETVSGLLKALEIAPLARQKRLGLVVKQLLKKVVKLENILDDPLTGLLRMLDDVESLVPEIDGVQFDELLDGGDIREFKRAILQYKLGVGESWLAGQTLDIRALLRSDDDGRTPINVVDISTLDEVADQQYAIARFSTELERWMRETSGREGLRALFYVDELGGGGGKHAFFPPSAVPVSKPPLRRLVKQARKYGLGVLLATQNVKDIDYQGLANIENWYVGKITNNLEQGYIRDGIGRNAVGQAGVDRQELGRILPSLMPGSFVNLGPGGTAQSFTAKYLVSVHTRPFPEFHDGWKDEFKNECEEAADRFLRGDGGKKVPVQYGGSGVFEDALLELVNFRPNDWVSEQVFQALLWLIRMGEHAEEALKMIWDVVDGCTDDECERMLSEILKTSHLTSKHRSEVQSRLVATRLGSQSVAAAVEVVDDMKVGAEQKLWTRFLKVVTGWPMKSPDVVGWTIHDDDQLLSVQSSHITVKTTPEVIRYGLIRELRKRIRDELAGVSEEELAGWYRKAKENSTEEESPTEQETAAAPSLDEVLKLATTADIELPIDDLGTLQTWLSEKDPHDFEIAVAKFLRTRGLSTELTRQSGDDGVDILATDPEGVRCAVQCKRYRGKPVGPAVIREIVGSADLYECDQRLVVTSSVFSKNARETAEKLDVIIIDGHELAIGLLKEKDSSQDAPIPFQQGS